MPDQFNNDPAPNAVFSAGDNNTSFLESLKLRAAEVAKSFRLDMWLARHTPSSVLPRLSKVLDAVKDEFADAVQAGGGVYCVGVSVGGRHALLLASELGADVLEGQKEVSEEAAGKVEEGMIGGVLLSRLLLSSMVQPLSARTLLVSRVLLLC
jgi:hypothetical protein